MLITGLTMTCKVLALDSWFLALKKILCTIY